MKVEDLKNYGKGFVDLMADPEMMKRMKKMMSGELRKELGIFGMIKLMWRMRKKTKRMKNHDWSRLREHVLTDQKFLDNIIQMIAMMKTLVDMEGMERASDIFRKIWDGMAYDMFASMFPSVEELKECEDAFECFKKWFNAFNAANVRDGLHEVDVVEDTNDVLAVNIKYCVWHEVAKEFGDPYLCYPSSCYGDEVFFPKFLAQAGCQFKRTGTLATGASVCDFRIERPSSNEEDKKEK